jgi:hypothetical protein
MCCDQPALPSLQHCVAGDETKEVIAMIQKSPQFSWITSTVAVATVMAAAAIDAQFNRAEAAAVCPNVSIMGTSTGLTRERAKKKARGNWERNARRKYGTSRISWWRGRDRSYSCRWVKRSGFHCFAFAKPCF